MDDNHLKRTCGSQIPSRPSARFRTLNTISLRLSLLQETLRRRTDMLGWILEDLEKIGGAKWAEQWKEVKKRQEEDLMGMNL